MKLIGGRYAITRVVKDKSVPKRYQRAGWIVFDTFYPLAHHPLCETRQDAVVRAKAMINHGKDLA